MELRTERRWINANSVTLPPDASRACRRPDSLRTLPGGDCWGQTELDPDAVMTDGVFGVQPPIGNPGNATPYSSMASMPMSICRRLRSTRQTVLPSRSGCCATPSTPQAHPRLRQRPDCGQHRFFIRIDRWQRAL